jgi:glyoxylase-like metal-dependent hydrolase (beta-lactamase superfamily II)
MRARLTIFLAAILFSVGVSVVHAQNPQTPVPSKLEKIKDDLYVILGEGGNTTVLLTDEGVILVDDKFERNVDDIVAKVKSLTGKPIKYVINTHAHGDHSGGNQKFLSSAQIIGHTNLRAAMIKGKLPGPPQLTFTDRMAVNLGGKEAVAYHFAPCHTDGDTFVYFPAHKVLASGDCFNTGNGQGVNLTGSSTFSFYIDYNTGGSFAGREKTADAALKLDFDTVVPGHGPVTNRAGFMKWRADITAIRNRITGMLREHKTKEDISKMLVSEFGWDPMGRAMQASLDGIMAELKP